MCNFLTLKMLPSALALIKTKNCQLFLPIGQKMLILRENLDLEFLMPGENFPLKKVKKMAIFCFDQRQNQW